MVFVMIVLLQISRRVYRRKNYGN